MVKIKPRFTPDVMAATILSVLLCAWYVAYHLHPVWNAAKQVAVALPEESTVAIDVESIKLAELFQPTGGAAGGLKTVGSITLHGIFFNQQDQAASRVLLSSTGSKPKLYKAGDSLPDGTEVEAIDAATVTIKRGGVSSRMALFTTKATEDKR